MNTHKGSALVITLLVVLGILVVGGGAYVATRSMEPAQTAEETDTTQMTSGDHPEEGHATKEDAKVYTEASISWEFKSLGERDYIPYTSVTVVVDGVAHYVGEYVGNCSEVGANGIALLAGELAGAWCYFGGGGNEIGVFAKEDGGIEVMVGDLDEGGPGIPGVRGNFKIRTDISL